MTAKQQPEIRQIFEDNDILVKKILLDNPDIIYNDDPESRYSYLRTSIIRAVYMLSRERGLKEPLKEVRERYNIENDYQQMLNNGYISVGKYAYPIFPHVLLMPEDKEYYSLFFSIKLSQLRSLDIYKFLSYHLITGFKTDFGKYELFVLSCLNDYEKLIGKKAGVIIKDWIERMKQDPEQLLLSSLEIVFQAKIVNKESIQPVVTTAIKTDAFLIQPQGNIGNNESVQPVVKTVIKTDAKRQYDFSKYNKETNETLAKRYCISLSQFNRDKREIQPIIAALRKKHKPSSKNGTRYWTKEMLEVLFDYCTEPVY